MIHRDVIYKDDLLSNLTTTFANIHTPLIAHFVAGGKISSVDASTTSLHPAWRESLFVIEPVVAWADTDSAAKIAGTQAYLTSITNKIGKVSGFPAGKEACYVNEADPNEVDWQNVFWSKQNYNRLLQIKQKYDYKGTFSCNKCVGSDVFGQ